MNATRLAKTSQKLLIFPLFLTPENKNFYGYVLATVGTVLYLSANHIHIAEPMLLPLSTFDQAIPFIATTVWIYISEYIYFIVIYVLAKDIKNLNQYFYSFLFLQTISVVVFFVWPTTYPRDLFPLPQDLDPVTTYVFSTLRATDSPANCCPSLHVSTVFLSSFIFLKEQHAKLPYFLSWGAAIGLSTLTTKQHYIIDVVTGLVMALVTYILFERYTDCQR